MKIGFIALNAKYIHSNLAVRYLYSQIYPIEKMEVVLKEYTINQSLDQILADIYREKLDIYFLSVYIWNWEMIQPLAENIKKIDPDSLLILGGPEVSYDAEKILQDNPHLDAIIRGEGEATIVDLMLHLKAIGNDQLQDQAKPVCISGMTWQKNSIFNPSDHVRRDPDRKLIDPLDSIASPYFTDQKANPIPQDQIIYYETTRGCPFSCTYCLSSIDKKVRFFSLDRVEKEIKQLLTYRPKQIKFVDRTFNVKPKRTLDLLQRLANLDDGSINFHFEMTTLLFTQEILDFCQQVRPGLFQFEIGVQTTNSATLTAIERKDELSKLKEIMKSFHQQDTIHIHLDLIVGLPFDNKASIMAAIDELIQLLPDQMQLGFLKVLKGTKMESQTIDHQIIYRSYPPYEVLQTNRLSAQDIFFFKGIEQMIENYYNSHHFYLSMRYLIRNEFSGRSSNLFAKLDSFVNQENDFSNPSLKKRFHLFMKFMINQGINQQIARNLLTFDYLRNGRSRSLPSFLYQKPMISKAEKRQKILAIIKEYQLEHTSINAYQLQPFDINIDRLMKDNQLVKQQTWIAFAYEQDKNSLGNYPYFVEKR